MENWTSNYLSDNEFNKIHREKSPLWKMLNARETTINVGTKVSGMAIAGVAAAVGTYLVQDYLNPQEAMDLWLQGSSVSEAEQMGAVSGLATFLSVGAVAFGKPVFDKAINLLQETIPFLKPIKGQGNWERQGAAISAVEDKLKGLKLFKDQVFIIRQEEGFTTGEIKAKAQLANAGLDKNYTYLSEVRGELVLSEYVDGKVKTIAKGDEAIENWVNDKVKIHNDYIRGIIRGFDGGIDFNKKDESKRHIVQGYQQAKETYEAKIVEELDLSEVREQEAEQPRRFGM